MDVVELAALDSLLWSGVALTNRTAFPAVPKVSGFLADAAKAKVVVSLEAKSLQPASKFSTLSLETSGRRSTKHKEEEPSARVIRAVRESPPRVVGTSMATVRPAVLKTSRPGSGESPLGGMLDELDDLIARRGARAASASPSPEDVNNSSRVLSNVELKRLDRVRAIERQHLSEAFEETLAASATSASDKSVSGGDDSADREWTSPLVESDYKLARLASTPPFRL